MRPPHVKTPARFAAAGVVLFLASLAACSGLEKAAAKDPMRCERDPKCASHSEKTRDCATQCSDDPACIERCREGQVDRLGQP
jgi:hypothetical protein